MRSPRTAKDDQPGPTGRRHSSTGGVRDHSVSIRTPRMTLSRSGPRKPGQAAFVFGPVGSAGGGAGSGPPPGTRFSAVSATTAAGVGAAGSALASAGTFSGGVAAAGAGGGGPGSPAGPGRGPGDEGEALGRDGVDDQHEAHHPVRNGLVNEEGCRKHRDDHQDDRAQPIGPGRATEEGPPDDDHQPEDGRGNDAGASPLGNDGGE